jgi:hypothetical protein
MSPLERFEIIGDLYYRRFHCLRPGKDEAPEAYRNSNSDENIEQFRDWLAKHAFDDALKRILELEEKIRKLEEQE